MVQVWVILTNLWSRFQGYDIIERQITQKWYKIELYLQRQTNRKLYGIWFNERHHFQWPWTTPNPVFKAIVTMEGE